MKITEITDKSIKFDNGSKLTYDHYQCCCEKVYPDFLFVKNYNCLGSYGSSDCFEASFEDDPSEFKRSFTCIDEAGFIFRTDCGDAIFVPCYNIQNGYYGTDLELVYLDKDDKEIWRIDIEHTEQDMGY